MAGVTIASALVPKPVPPHFFAAVAIAAILPDVDAIGRPFGRGDLAILGGHRALTHSLTFAACLALVLAATAFPSVRSPGGWIRVWLAVALAVASHGAIDATTTYGEGIEFLAPWSSQRFWAPWRPLGGGLLRDTVLFVLCYLAAYILMRWRGIALPRWLYPSLLGFGGGGVHDV
jgi:inner membrane protein